MADIDVYKEWLGIPEGDRPPDHYTLLRLVMFEDDAEKIQNNYRKLNGHVRKFATGQYLKPSQDLLNELAKAMLCLTDAGSKMEYDASLGRDTSESIPEEETRTTLQHLVQKDILKRSQINEIEHFAEARGLSHRDAVVQMKLAEPVDATRAMAAALRMSFVDLDDMLPEDDVLDGLPRNVVKRHTCLPLFEDGGHLLVACADEPSPELEDEVRMRFGIPMRGVMAVPRQINQAIARHYAPGTRTEAEPRGEAAKSSGKSKGRKSEPKKKQAKPRAPGAPLTKEDKANRRGVSLIVLCWSVILPMLVMNFAMQVGGLTQAVVISAIAAVVAAMLKLTYWR